MEWSNEFVLEFLDLYQKEPLIWNPSHNLHKNRNEVHDAWKRIQEELSVTCSISDLKKKKDSLMASFRTCLSKIKKSSGTGTGADEVYKPNWFAYEKMANFLRERDQPRSTINTEDAASQLDTNKENPIDIDSDAAEDDDEVPRESPNKNRIIFKSPLEKKRKTNQDEKLRQKMDEAFSILKTSTQKEDRKKDDCEIYGELLATKLRKMDERTRDIAMNKIDNMLFEMKTNPPYQNQYTPHMHQMYQGIQGIRTPSPCSSGSSSVSHHVNILSPQPQSSLNQHTDLSQPSSPYSHQATDSSSSDYRANNVPYGDAREFYEKFV